MGDSLVLTCTFDMNFNSIQWLYNNNVVTLSTVSPQVNLTFSPVNDSVHNRQYTCRAITPYGVQEQTYTIQVQGKTFVVAAAAAVMFYFILSSSNFSCDIN